MIFKIDPHMLDSFVKTDTWLNNDQIRQILKQNFLIIFGDYYLLLKLSYLPRNFSEVKYL